MVNKKSFNQKKETGEKNRIVWEMPRLKTSEPRKKLGEKNLEY